MNPVNPQAKKKKKIQKKKKHYCSSIDLVLDIPQSLYVI